MGILWELAQKVRISSESRVVIMYVIRLCHYMKSVNMKQIPRFKTSVGQSYCIFYSIPVVIMISSTDFTELKATILSSFHGFNESQTPLAYSIGSRVLAMRAQSGGGLAAPWCLTFRDVLRASFAT